MSCCGVFAEYKPIPEHLCSQYKQEVEETINTQYPIAIKKTEQIRKEAHGMYLKVLQNKSLYMNYATKNYDMIIYSGEFEFLSKIIDITDKYVKVNGDDAIATDYTGALLDFLDPYFKDNKIDTAKINHLENFVYAKYKEIEKEQDALHTYIYPEEH